MTAVKIRALAKNDYDFWLPLWDGNNEGQRNEAVTEKTWERLMDTHSDVRGLCAMITPPPSPSPRRGEGWEGGPRIIGLVHYILHPTTGSIEPVCYMQDVYVDPAYRKQGIARALVSELAAIGRAENWARMYWLAEAKNTAAQNLYKNLGVKLDFTLHVLPLRAI